MDKCIKCEINVITHRNNKLCDTCYKELRKAQKKEYNKLNKDKLKISNEIYRANNKDKISEINKKWYQIPENKERKKLQNSLRYKK